MNKFIILLKRIFIVLFICAFVINITITSYANSHIKIYNTGVVEGVGAALAGGGPFFGLVGLSLLAAGLVCESLSDDPTDGAIEYFVSDCIFNDHFAGTALEVIYKNIEIDENGNVNYKQLEDNINAYVEANDIAISAGSAVSFENGVLRVSPEIISSIASDLRAVHTSPPLGDLFAFKGTLKYSITFDLASGFVFPVGSDADIMIKNVIANNWSYVLDKKDGYISLFYHQSKTIYAGYTSENGWCCISGVSKSAPYGGWKNFNEDGTLSNVDGSIGYTQGYIYQKQLSHILYYGNGFYFDSDLLSILGSPSLPVSNNYPIEGWKNLPVRDLYDGLANDIFNVPVIDFPIGGDGTIVIDGNTVSDLDEACKNVIGVLEGLGDNVTDKEKEQSVSDAITNEIDNALENTQERVETSNPSFPSNPSVGALDSPGLDDKFPFCIPFDLIDLISALDAEPEVPKFTIPIIKNEKYGWDYSIDVDWSDFDVVAKVCRSVEVFCFIGFMILKTRTLIRG